MQAICCPSCPLTQHNASNKMPNTTSGQTCYPACCSRRHATRLAAEQTVLPIMPLNTTYYPVNSRTVEPKMLWNMLPNWQPSTKRCTSSAPLNTRYCPTQYAVQQATQLAAKHKMLAHTAHLNMLPLKHATQHTAQHDMLCNMLPNSPLKNYILLNMLPKKSLSTTCYMTQHTAQDDALCNTTLAI